PSFYFLDYDPARWRVRNLQLVPRHFLSLSAIERKPPLRSHARRAGWVGCDILLSRLPADARIQVVYAGAVISVAMVRSEWRRFSFLRGRRHEARGWTADVLACVRRLPTPAFSLQDFYGSFSEELQRLHPENRHVEDKIRQQLQFLRERGVLEFLGRGRYRQMRWCPVCGHDLVPNALPQDGGGHRRLACPECGTWLWDDVCRTPIARHDRNGL
ncbi:MAG TPA: DpnI domain-containing protein, partial [Methylomirabilota bacterium]|nr:DpnI domain-containing protein [Methylomirabilota bacterium]